MRPGGWACIFLKLTPGQLRIRYGQARSLALNLASEQALHICIGASISPTRAGVVVTCVSFNNALALILALVHKRQPLGASQPAVRIENPNITSNSITLLATLFYYAYARPYLSV